MLFKNFKRIKSMKKKNSHTINYPKEPIPDNRKCRDCEYAVFQKGFTSEASKFICYLDPEKPVSMGKEGKHSLLQLFRRFEYHGKRGRL